VRLDRRRRPIVLALAIAVAAAASVLGVVAVTRPGTATTTDPTQIAKGQPVPSITGTTLDGAAFDLAAFRGRPVIVNFWGPQCIPCRDEFPLFKAKLIEHAADGLAVIGILTDNGPDPARTFVAEQGATWPTVIDPGGALKRSYRVLGLPQSYFIDRDGVLRSIQVGWLQTADFERQYALISGGS
jgi:cytochrome c biogenesis protein CcmG/thiol:disulfide interchange protein DsbE